MKEPKTTPIIPVSELILNAVYLNTNDELVQVKNIDHENKELKLFNITDHYNVFIPFKRHSIVKRIR